MRPQRITLLSALVLGLTLAAFAISSTYVPASVAQAAPVKPSPASSGAISAAPAVTYTVYLPMISRSCTTTQLLQDTGFEAGLPNSFWHTTSTISSTILDNSSIPTPNPTHSGSWKAFLGGNNSVSESVWQGFAVPAGTTSLKVTFWRQVNTFEPSPATFDSLQIQVRDSVGTPLQTIYTLYDLDVGTTWVQQVIAVSPTYASQNIQLAFVAATDTSNPTSFFVDDVTVSACH